MSERVVYSTPIELCINSIWLNNFIKFRQMWHEIEIECFVFFFFAVEYTINELKYVSVALVVYVV